MNLNEFEKQSASILDFIQRYLRDMETFPVTSRMRPGDIRALLEERFPAQGEAFEEILSDFESKIFPGLTHWQHPMFFAYFPANASPPSVLAEMLVAALGQQCMLWSTSPAAHELEGATMEALRSALGLPAEFTGVIQEGGSAANLTAILTAREAKLRYHGNRFGLGGYKPLIVYASEEAHSSVERAVRIAGLGTNQLRKIGTDSQLAMRPELLQAAIERDVAEGAVPLAVVATLGTTSSVAFDPLRAIGEIAKRNGLWLHVDAAYAGSALLLPEYRWMIDGIDAVDSFVVNPHKGMLVSFDCSAYYTRDQESLVRTFRVSPEYLKTPVDPEVTSYSDCGIALGRRFRALKLWFVLRSYGIAGLQEIFRRHFALAAELAAKLKALPDFELLAPPALGNICFRHRPDPDLPEEALNDWNMALLDSLNASGEIFLSHTKLRGATAIRVCVGQTNTGPEHVERAFGLIVAHARKSAPLARAA